MTLMQLFERLSYGELSNLYIGMDGDGAIPPAKIPALISHINAGLTALYTRFPLRQKEVIIQSHDEISIYYLRPEYSSRNPATLPATKYIMDSLEDPFTGDVLRITRVFNELGCPLPLNDDNQCSSLFTAGYDALQIPHPNDEVAYSVMYWANHPEIPLETTNFSEVEIYLPTSFEEALMYYVASRVFTNMGAQEHLAKGELFMAKYEAKCQFFEDNNVAQTSVVPTNIKPLLNGWV